MTRTPQIGLLPDGRRLHLQDGPIDLILEGFGHGDLLAWPKGLPVGGA